MISKTLKITALVNGLSLLKIPLLAFCAPQVIELSPQRTRAKIRLGWRTGNHLGVMYFGALSMGAELSIALKAIEKIEESKQRIDFIFKDFQAEFLRRGDGPVIFSCDEADAVAQLIETAKTNSDRYEGTFQGYAFVESKPEQIIMKYKLTLSVKNRSPKT